MNGLQSVAAVTITGAFTFGMVIVLLGTLRSVLVERLRLSEDRGDWLLASLNLTLIPMMLMSGILIDRLGVKSVFLVGSLMTSVAIFLLAISTTGKQTFGAILLIGTGAACLSTGSSVLMTHAFYPEHLAASQNMGNVFFALGALLAPSLVEWLLVRLDFRRGVSLLAVVCLLPAVVAALTARSAFPEIETPGSLGMVLSDLRLWLAAAVFFFYGPLERSVEIWAERYLTGLGFGKRGFGWLLAGFWLCFLGSRLLAAMLEQGSLSSLIAQGWVIVIASLAAGVILGNLAGARDRLMSACGILALGLVLGPIFPTLVGLLFEYFPTARGTAYGAMFGFGAMGALFLPPILGSIARRTGVHRTMRVSMMTALVMTLIAVLLALFPVISTMASK